MNSFYINPLCYGIIFLSIFFIGELLYHKLKLEAEWSRKFVHITSGLLIPTFPLFLEDHWQVLFLTISFLAILILSKNLNYLPSINAVDRKTVGSLLYPVSMYLVFCIYKFYEDSLFFFLPVIILALADPSAAFAGKKYPKFPYKIFNEIKTMSGSIAFFTIALISSLIIFRMDGRLLFTNYLLLSILISLTAAMVERISIRGIDNASIPCIIILDLMVLKELALI